MKKISGKGIGIESAIGLDQRIITIRGQRVMLSPDLAEMYQVETRALIQAVKRNLGRFPDDFMFQLTSEEAKNMKSQNVISSWGGVRRATPYAFTELGVAMLSSVLRSETAIHVNISIMRAFVRMREVLTAHKDIARKVDEHEHRLNDQDEVIISIVEEMSKQRKALPTVKPMRKIGFRKKG